MPQISRFKLNDQVLEKLFDLFFEIVGKQSNKQEFITIVNDLLTPVERVMIAKRIAIFYLLLKEKDYITICHVLKVSPATVSKFNLLRQNSIGLMSAFNKIMLSDKFKLFLDEVLDIVMAPGTPYINWSAAWRRRKELQRKKQEGI